MQSESASPWQEVDVPLFDYTPLHALKLKAATFQKIKNMKKMTFKVSSLHFKWSPLGSRVTQDLPFGEFGCVVYLWGRGQATPHSLPRADEWALCGPVETSRIPPSTSIWRGL